MQDIKFEWPFKIGQKVRLKFAEDYGCDDIEYTVEDVHFTISLDHNAKGFFVDLTECDWSTFPSQALEAIT